VKVWHVAFDREGRRIYTSSGNETVRVLDTVPLGERSGCSR